MDEQAQHEDIGVPLAEMKEPNFKSPCECDKERAASERSNSDAEWDDEGKAPKYDPRAGA